MHLDIAVGEAKIQPESEKEHVKDLAGRVRELNSRLHDIRREQQFQREREIQFRDLSEATNRRAVYWSLVQLAVLFYMCVWQLRHLRGFFESKSMSISTRHFLRQLILRYSPLVCPRIQNFDDRLHLSISPLPALFLSPLSITHATMLLPQLHAILNAYDE